MVFFTRRKNVGFAAALLVMATFLSSCGFHRKKYDNPITKDTQQPDKVLFDRAIGDIEHGRYEVARLTLNTMINTYDTSEYLAKAKLAVADSWYREGGTHGLAQAEAEYKDFILFYPQMEESAESQWKVCQIHYKQMEKADRDPSQAQRAEDECRQVLVAFPNSKYVPQAKQMLRNVQEVLAEKEFLAGTFYWGRQAFPAASARLLYVTDQYPLFSQADEALWELADSYNRLGDRWEDKAAQAYARIVKDYPLSVHADDAKEKLEKMKRPVPAADPEAVARMKYNEEHYVKASKLNVVTSPVKGLIVHAPDVRTAAKVGDPSMETKRPPTPISVPTPAGGTPGTSGGEVTVATTSNSDIDSKPDARTGGAPPAAVTAGGTPAATGTTAAAGTDAAKPATTGTDAAKATPLPTNYQTLNLKQKQKKPKKVKQPKNAVNSTALPAPGASSLPVAPAAGTTPATAPAPGATPDAAAPKTDPPK
jgi:outer membrane protein assembly factor BamD